MQMPPIGAANLGAGPSSHDVRKMIEQQERSMELSTRMGILQLVMGSAPSRWEADAIVSQCMVLEHWVQTGERMQKPTDVSVMGRDAEPEREDPGEDHPVHPDDE